MDLHDTLAALSETKNILVWNDSLIPEEKLTAMWLGSVWKWFVKPTETCTKEIELFLRTHETRINISDLPSLANLGVRFQQNPNGSPLLTYINTLYKKLDSLPMVEEFDPGTFLSENTWLSIAEKWVELKTITIHLPLCGPKDTFLLNVIRHLFQKCRSIDRIFIITNGTPIFFMRDELFKLRNQLQPNTKVEWRVDYHGTYESFKPFFSPYFGLSHSRTSINHGFAELAATFYSTS